MEVKRLSETVSVAPQIQPAEVADLAAFGFRAIICNRPDGEGARQPGFGDIARAAAAAGLEAANLPVVSGKVTDADAAGFGRLPKPVLAYCRSGTRSARLWSLAKAAGWLDVDPTTLRHARFPGIYGPGDWKAMLRGREWLAQPELAT